MKIDEGVRVLESRVRACVTAAFCSYLGSHSQQDAYQCIFKTGARRGKTERAVHDICVARGSLCRRRAGGAPRASTVVRGEQENSMRQTLKYQDD